MKRAFLLAALLLAFSAPAHSADLGTPKKETTFEDLLAMKAPKPTSCYVETSVAGTFLRDTREAVGSVGGGCDMKLTNLVLGAGVRADIADWRNTGSLFFKLGLAVNSAATLYSKLEGKFDDWKLGKSGQFLIGAGAEMKLEFWSPQLWGFIEGDIPVSKWGTDFGKDEITTRVGLRYRF